MPVLVCAASFTLMAAVIPNLIPVSGSDGRGGELQLDRVF